MIVIIESNTKEILISGRVSSAGQLKHRMLQVLKDTGYKDFCWIFCARYQFEILPFDPNIDADYIMDLDTHRILTTRNIQ